MELDTTSKTAEEKTEQNKILEEKKVTLESDVKQYEKALQKVNKRVQSLEKTLGGSNNQSIINFEAGEAISKAEKEKEKSELLRKKLRTEIEEQIENEKDEIVRKWQKKIYWHLLWVIPFSLTAFFFVLPLDQNPFTEEATRFRVAGIIMVPVILIFLYLIQNRFWNENNIKARKENHKVSERLRNKLKELE